MARRQTYQPARNPHEDRRLSMKKMEKQSPKKMDIWKETVNKKTKEQVKEPPHKIIHLKVYD